jgi:hypothetical protein
MEGIKERILEAQRIGNRKQVDFVFCLPGHAPSSYVQSMNVNLAMMNMISAGYTVAMRMSSGSVINAVRNGCLSDRGKKMNQKPFDAMNMDYKFMIWIDSDNIVTHDQIMSLIELNTDIAAGWCKQSPKSEKINCGAISHTQSEFKSTSMTLDEMEAVTPGRVIEVDYAGFGLMVIKNGVFESLGYPWFRSWEVTWVDEQGDMCADTITDDLGFCIRARKAGYKIHVAKDIRILHQKVDDI